MTTSCPRPVNSRTPAGVIATRYSSTFTSLGTPIFIRLLLLRVLRRLTWGLALGGSDQGAGRSSDYQEICRNLLVSTAMDEIDDRILSILATNGRASFAAIGAEVGLSPHGTADRIR